MALKPPKFVKTVRNLIYWLYAENISKVKHRIFSYIFHIKYLE